MRPPRQKIAEHFLTGKDKLAWKDEQPGAHVSRISKTTLLFCPGLLNGMLPVRAFETAFPRLEERFSLRVLRSDSHPARGCEANMADILGALNEGTGFDAAAKPIAEAQATPPGDVFLICYSKGAPDTLTLLANHPELKSRVRCIFTWAGAIGGSETADDVYRKAERWGTNPRLRRFRTKMKGLVPPFLTGGQSTLRRLDEYDAVGAVRDLTTNVRDSFMEANKETLDGLNIPMFYMRGATRLQDVPFSQRSAFRKLAQIDPQNDMQVTSRRAELPFAMATDLGVLNGHHWDLAYPAFSERRWWLNKTTIRFPRRRPQWLWCSWLSNWA